MLNNSKQNKKHNYLNLTSLLLSTVCTCLFYNKSYARYEVTSELSDYAHYEYDGVIKTLLGGIGNQDEYILSTIPTLEAGERTVVIDTNTYYFTPSVSESNDIKKALKYSLLRYNKLSTSPATGTDGAFKFNLDSQYYYLSTRGYSKGNRVYIIESDRSDYLFKKTLSDGSTKYYKKLCADDNSDYCFTAIRTPNYINNENLSIDYDAGYSKQGDSSVTGGAVVINSDINIPYHTARYYENQAKIGGAVYINPNAKIGTVMGEYFANTAVTTGGGIYNEGNIVNIIADFGGNKAGTDGGAIYNTGSITSLYGEFDDNESGQSGGAIWNSNAIGNITSIFNTNRASESGGAIYNQGSIGLFADEQNIEFFNNTDSTGYNDLYGGTYNLNAQLGYNINFGGSIRNATALNINNDSSATNRGGDYIFNNTVDAGMNLYNGANVKLSSIKQTDGTTSYGVINTPKTMTVDNVEGSYINMQNNHIDTNTVGGMILGSNLGLSIDTDLYSHSASTSDKLVSTASATGDGKMVINAINLMHSAYGEGDSININIADENTKGKVAVADDILDNITGATNYYTKVEYNEDTGDLVFTDKLVNKSTLDKALEDAGISDMSIYAKTADVADTYATKTALSDGLGGKVDTSAFNEYKTSVADTYATKTALSDGLSGKVDTSVFNEYKTTVADTYATKTALTDGLGGKVDTSVFNEYKTTVGNTYATKDAISDMLTKTEAGNTYATKDALNGYATTASLDNYATKSSVYTTTQADDKFATKSSLNSYVTTESLGTTLSGYATTSSVYTKEQANEAFATKGSSYTKAESDAKYLTSHQDISGKANVSDVYTKTEADEKFLTSADMSGYATTDSVYTKTEANNTFATKGDVYTKTEINTKLEGYATASSVSTLSETVTGLGTTVSGLSTTVSNLQTAVDGKADKATVTELQGTVSDLSTTVSGLNTTVSGLSTTVSGLNTTVSNLQTAVDGKADKSDVTTLQGTVSDLSTTVSGLNTTVTGLGTTVSGLQTAVDGKADKATVTELQGTVSGLQTTVAGKADKATVTELQGTISDLNTTVSGLNTTVTGLGTTVSNLQTAVDGKVNQSDFNEYKTSNNNAVAAAVNRIEQAENNIAGKQDALTTEQMAVLNSGITAADVQTVKDVTDTINTMSQTVTDLSADFGDVADFKNSTTGNIKNDVLSSTTPNATTVTKAIANMDATMGQIHGLAAKVGVANGGKNLGQNTTVEEHLTALAGAIGDRTNYTMQNYIVNNQSVARSLDALDIAVGNLRDDFATVQAENDARFQNIDRRIKKLDDKISKGIAGSNALAALKPLDSSYRSQLAVALGGFDGDQAVAFGAFHYINNRTMINAGISYSGRNYNSYNVGIVFGF